MNTRNIKHDTNITSLRPELAQQRFNSFATPDIFITMLEKKIAKQIFKHLRDRKVKHLPTKLSQTSFTFKYIIETDPCDPYDKIQLITRIQVEIERKADPFTKIEILETKQKKEFYFLFEIITNAAIIEKMQFQICYDQDLLKLGKYDEFGETLHEYHPYVLKEIQTFIQNNQDYVKDLLGITFSIQMDTEMLDTHYLSEETLECFDLLNF
jgi:hypothetical protein